MAKRNDGSADDDGGEVIDILAKDPPAGGAEEPAARVEAEAPAIEPREAVLNRDEPRGEDPPAREDARREDPEPREQRRRGETPEEYSRRVQGRINREIALRKRSDRRYDEQVVANDELRDRLAKLERRQSVQSITDDAAKSISAINKEIEAIKVRLAAAIEAGDTVKQLDINIELSTKIAEKTVIEKRSEYQAEQARAAAAAPGGDEGGGGQPRKPSDRAITKWQTENRKWWNLNRFRAERADAIELDKELRQEVKDGLLDMEEYSDEYFAELSTRVKRNYPDLDVRGLDGEEIEAETDDVDSRRSTERDEPRRDTRRQAPRSHPGGNMGTRDGRRQGGDERQLAEQGRVRLGNADYAQMRQYGLDPNNPAHKKAFAKERMRTILTEGRDQSRGGGR